MGSIVREFRRNTMKRMYDQFKVEFRTEKAKRLDDSSRGPKLGRRPTYRQYVAMYEEAIQKSKEQFEKMLREQQEQCAAQDAKIDPTWEEEKAK